MADNYDITNLTLDDNSFELLPEGDYRFKVESFEVAYIGAGSKIPQGTQQITTFLSIPVIKDGEIKSVTVKNNLNIYSKALFAVRQFAESIGLCPEKGRSNLNLTSMTGHEGVCSIEVRESSRGNQFNSVMTFYPPSKAPKHVLNDDAWNRSGLEKAVSEGDLPFEI